MRLMEKTLGLLDGRYDVGERDLQTTMLPALRHRLVLSFEGQAEGIALTRSCVG
jgi:MoxR-like ATPase